MDLRPAAPRIVPAGAASPPSVWTGAWGLLAWMVGCELVGILGVAATGTADSDWYRALVKPAFQPPGWVFGPTWTLLYAMMGLAAWRIVRVGVQVAPWRDPRAAHREGALGPLPPPGVEEYTSSSSWALRTAPGAPIRKGSASGCAWRLDCAPTGRRPSEPRERLLVRVTAQAGARRVALRWFWVQLALNAAWTPVFFGAHEIGVALGVLIALTLAVAMTVRAFLKVDRVAAGLLVPYLGWVAFASVLNAAILCLNGAA